MKYLQVATPQHTKCPACAAMMPPVPGSRVILAWYVCPQCDAQWAARVINGVPVTLIQVDRALFDKEQTQSCDG